MYTGDESETAKVASVAAFVEGRANVLIISLRAGAGLDGLQQVSRTVVIGELDWSPQVHQQNIGRVYRDGQSEPCVAYYLVADEGSDPVIADVLGLKEAQATGIVDPDRAGVPHLVGAADDHIRKLAEDVLRRSSAPRPAASEAA
jgi:SNF2 family DNA or RNA helicase